MIPTMRNRDDLIAAIEAGVRVKYLFFWGHTETGEEVTAACLSQWYPSPFEVEGVTYLTAEHWMMAGKARLFRDSDELTAVLASTHPGEAKRAGRRVRGFDQVTWERHRFELVIAGNVHKFGQDERLRSWLLGTGDRVLVEASPRDRVWGIGMGRANPDATDPARWRGLNLLGFALMEARDRLRPGYMSSVRV